MASGLPWIVGFATFVICGVAVAAIEGPARCNSGWQSPSIGRQGACSSHGGVAGSFALVAGIGSGVGMGIVTASLQGRKRGSPSPRGSDPIPASRATTAHPSKSGVRYCGHCEGAMRPRKFEVGQPIKGEFWECTKSGCGRLAPLDI